MTQAEALAILKTGVNVFLTGEPGAGKTYTINQYIRYARSHGLEPAITASTGIAATHIHGVTIHSWSGVGIKSQLTRSEIQKIAGSEGAAKRIRRASLLIIDEISMLPASTLDLVDRVCRVVRASERPFGGLQVIFVGDFFQLPPIVKREVAPVESQTSFFDEDAAHKLFAYDSSAWLAASPMVCYLSEQHRQDDPAFLDLLSAIRGNEVRERHMEILHSVSHRKTDDNSIITKLFSHNADVDHINKAQLYRLPGETKTFKMTHIGQDNIVTALKKGCLSPEVLELKVGATVMCTKNNPKDGYVNGTLARIEKFDDLSGNPIIVTKYNKRIEMKRATWAVEDNGFVRAEITQIPLRLAWAITVHKSQGMSLDAAVMDLSSVFAYGQGYVALSRVRTLSGVNLLGFNERALQVHPEIIAKDAEFRVASDEAVSAYKTMSEDELTELRLDFIMRSGGSVEETAPQPSKQLQPKEKKISTYDETLRAWQSGKTLSEIADLRSLTSGTIVNHIEKLVHEKKLVIDNPEQLLPRHLMDGLLEIQQTFLDLETDRLTPVFEDLGGKYSYDELRLVKLVLK